MARYTVVCDVPIYDVNIESIPVCDTSWISVPFNESYQPMSRADFESIGTSLTLLFAILVSVKVVIRFLIKESEREKV